MASSPPYQRKEGGLATAVLAHQAHLVAGVHGGGRVVQQRAAAAISLDLTGKLSWMGLLWLWIEGEKTGADLT